MAFQITPAHADIFAAVQDPSGGNLMISAVAGSGKSSTLIQIMNRIPAMQSVLFLAFGKEIAAELGRRIPSHAQARTLNSLGFNALARHLRTNLGISTKLEGNKTRILGKAMLGAQWQFMGGKIAKMVSLAKSAGIVPDGCGNAIVKDTYAAWASLAEHHDVFDGKNNTAPDLIIDHARALLLKSCQTLDVIDYDDQKLLAFALDAEMPAFDFVMVDESQDLSPLEHELVARCLKSDGRLISVGDPHQAIYGFRGADSSSMANLKTRFSCRELPLHVSYRCARSVVEEAQRFVSHIKAHDGAPEGTVDRSGKDIEQAGIKVGDMVICRFTAPVVQAAFTFLRAGTAATILGRDIGKNLITLIKKLNPLDLDDATARVAEWEAFEMAKAVKKEDEAKQVQIQDKADVLRTFIDASSSVDDMIARIESMFSDDNADNVVTCCTIHKSKGLESDRVFVVKVAPSKWAKKPWQQEQEKNLCYVAATRAKTHLAYVSVGSTKQKRDPNAPAPKSQKLVAVTGNTFPVKDQLRAMGARWDSAARVWMVTEDKATQAQDIVRRR